MDDIEELREDTDHSQSSALLAHRQLVVKELHDLGLVSIWGSPAALVQVRLHPSLRRLVAQLQA